jgi:hypothetical protein
MVTLSPLARPGKAIALEAQIELWSAIIRPSLLFSFRKRHDVVMNNRSFVTPGEKPSSTDTGLAATIGFPFVRPVGGEIFVLTSPFIELFSPTIAVIHDVALLDCRRGL